MMKLEEVRAVYAAREQCLVRGSHTCGGSCYALRAPRYAYNGGPHTPEGKLRAEALGGDEEALDALLVLAGEDAIRVHEEKLAFRDGLLALDAAGSGHVLLQNENGQYVVARQDDYVSDPDYGPDYEGTSIVTHHGSQFHRDELLKL